MSWTTPLLLLGPRGLALLGPRGLGVIVLILLPCACRSQDPAPAGALPEERSQQARSFHKQLPKEKDLGKRALTEVETVVGFGPRTPGSKARQRTADYIVKRLTAMGLKPKRESFVADAEKIRFENLRCPIPGRNAKILILGTHYDTKRSLAQVADPEDRSFEGANDGGSGTGLLLALAKNLSALPKAQRPSLELVFFDGEESLDVKWNDAKRALYGSRHYAKKHLVKGHKYGGMILLDMVGSKKLAIDLDQASTATLIPPFRAAARSLGYQKYFFQQKTEVDDDHIPLLEKGLPCLDLIQFEKNPQWHTFDDNLSNLSPRSLAIVGRTLWWALPDLEILLLNPAQKNPKK